MPKTLSTVRRKHSEQFKARVLAACEREDVSVIEVAKTYAVHVNLVHRWRRKAAASELTSPSAPAVALSSFVEIAVPARQSNGQVRIELRRGATEVVMY